MQLIEMVSRPSLSTMERMKASMNQSRQECESTLANNGSSESIHRRPVILDAFDKVILECADQIASPV